MAYLQQLRELFLRLSMRQRILIGVAAVLVIAGIFGLRYWQTERNFKTLFTNMAPESAAPVLARLKESATPFRLEDGGKTIKVPAEKVDELRLQMAAAELPKTGRNGYDLFDKPNFGTSEFAEQINYHRAVEGELERSVMTLHEVESARVHIAFPRQSLFLENRQPAKASVILKLKQGAKLSKENVRAIMQLTSYAVTDLDAENVSILDTQGNLLSVFKKEGENDEEVSKKLIEYRERMERDLKQKIRDTLEPLMGPDGFTAQVSLDCDLASGDQSEETFDPSRSVMVNSQRSEGGTTPLTATGVPGTPSNLPRPTSRPGTGSGTPLFNKSENTTFQTSRVIRHVKFPHGQIKKLSASVLLDHIVKVDGGKRTVEAPSPDRIRAIKEIVSGVVGYQQERGDLIVVEAAFPFEATRNLPPLNVAPAAPARPRLILPAAIPDWLRVPLEGHVNWLIDQNWLPATVIVLVLGILYGVFRLIRAAGSKIGGFFGRILRGIFGAIKSKMPFGKGKKKGQHVDVTLDPSVEGAASTGQLEAGQSGGEHTLKPLDEQLRDRDELQAKLTADALMQLEIPKAEVRRVEVLTRHLADLAQKDPEGVANLIRTWTEGAGGIH